MMTCLRKVGRICAAAAVVAGVLGTSQASASSTCYTYSTLEVQMADATNDARVRAGQGPLRLDPELSRVATRQAVSMANHDRIFHTPVAKLTWRVTNWQTLGENVGVGGDIGSLHEAFMASPGHRDNVLGAYSHVGVGIERRAGRIWVAVLFESETDPGTRMPMPC